MRFSHLLLDIEGTIVLDKKYTPVPGSVEWFNNLAAKGVRARLVTNNTTESPDDFYLILRRKGFLFKKEDYFTCLTEAVRLMRSRHISSCLALTVEKAKVYLEESGIKPVDSEKAQGVLVGYDPALSYREMNLAVRAIMEHGATLFTLHRNRRLVDEHGKIVMSSGPIAAAIEYATLKRAVVCGKPNRRFFLDSVAGWDVPRDRILMVSDDPFADLMGAKKLGMSTCWVLTGSQRDRRIIEKIPEAFRPDIILNSVVDIPA